jgi:tripeptidyl-peptidase-1
MSLNGADMAGLTARMESIAASGGKWLTEAELAQYASPSAADEAAVRAFLVKNGIPASAQKWSKLRDSVSVDSTVGQTAKLFQAQFLEYSVDGQRAARTKAYTIPSEIANSVQDAYPLSTYGSIRRASTGFTPLAEEDIPAGEAAEEEALERRQSTPSSCSTNSVTPACLRAYYGTSSVTPKATSGVVDIGVMGYIDQYVSNTGECRVCQPQQQQLTAVQT